MRRERSACRQTLEMCCGRWRTIPAALYRSKKGDKQHLFLSDPLRRLLDVFYANYQTPTTHSRGIRNGIAAGQGASRQEQGPLEGKAKPPLRAQFGEYHSRLFRRANAGLMTDV